MQPGPVAANVAKVHTPLICGGHSRPVPFLSYSGITEDGFFLISACLGTAVMSFRTLIPNSKMESRCFATARRVIGLELSLATREPFGAQLSLTMHFLVRRVLPITQGSPLPFAFLTLEAKFGTPSLESASKLSSTNESSRLWTSRRCAWLYSHRYSSSLMNPTKNRQAYGRLLLLRTLF